MIYKDISKNLEKIKIDYKNAPDITYKKLKFKRANLCLVFNQSLSSSDSINNYILKELSYNLNNKKKIDNNIEYFYNLLPGNNIKKINTFKDVYKYLSNGFSIIFLDNCKEALAIETKEDLARNISEPQTEQTISGPKDAFTENYIKNIGLIRKRIKTTNLVLEENIIGKETKTKVGLLYMDNIVEDRLLENVRNKIKNIDIDGILDSTYIREIIVDKNSMFPTIETTERPDLCCMSLLDGKICIVVENSPNALLIPTFFIDLFFAPEDKYQKPKNVVLTKIIRILAFLIAIILPAFYIAIITYNHETIPVTLIINFAAQRDGVPFPAIVEALSMTLIFEILRESDIRMPSLAGSAISILGAIVLGDAAVTAGIVSPIMVIVIAMSAICGLMFSHISMVNAIRWWRIIFMLFATFLGLPGLIFAGFLFIILTCSIKSFGKPYLYPIAPFNFNVLNHGLFNSSIKSDKYRNPLLTDKNKKRSNL